MCVDSLFAFLLQFAAHEFSSKSKVLFTSMMLIFFYSQCQWNLHGSSVNFIFSFFCCSFYYFLHRMCEYMSTIFHLAFSVSVYFLHWNSHNIATLYFINLVFRLIIHSISKLLELVHIIMYIFSIERRR